MSTLPTPIVALSPARSTADALALADETFDVLVIGGGVVGAGTALDAASRGLSVAIVEAEDWAAGTSSRSSKLIHGGLRYIQTLQVSLVREALRERSVLLRIAPHLVRPAQFLYPLRHRLAHPYVGAGVAFYDLLARLPRHGVVLPRARHLGARAARELAPALRRERLVGGVLYNDAQVDDARFVLDVVRTAASYGARAVSRARVVGLIEDHGTLSGARVRFVETGDEIDVRARSVVSATGVWTDELLAMADAVGPELRPSKGVHLVVPRDAIDSQIALIIPTATSVLFVLPWGAHWIIGTTDTPWPYGPAQPVATSSDIEFLLGELNAVLARPLRSEAIESVYVGLRPLIGGRAASMTKLSREHAVVVPRAGLSLVTGGKFTTYRAMAQDALDAVLESAGIEAKACRTRSILIAGSDGYADVVARSGRIAAATGLEPFEVARLLGRYGGLLDEVIESEQVTEPYGHVRGAAGYLRVEAAYAVTHEGARHLDDVLTRRTRIAIETADRGVSAAEEVAALMAPLLGWTEAVRDAEVVAYRTAVTAELQAERLPDDATAQSMLVNVLDAG